MIPAALASRLADVWPAAASLGVIVLTVLAAARRPPFTPDAPARALTVTGPGAGPAAPARAVR